MKRKLLSLTFALFFCLSCASEDIKNIFLGEKILITKITSNQLHNAFTDLVFFNNQFFLAFRESDLHVGGKDGVIKVYNSPDGINFNIIKTINVDGIDLRDPKFSVNEEKNELMLYIHGAQFKNSNFLGRSDYVLKYLGEDVWSDSKNVLLDNLKKNTEKLKGNEAWPWRITWHKNKAYSVGYAPDIFDLYQSEDGLFFKGLNAFEKRPGFPNETTLRFRDDGDMYALYRNSKGNSFLGKSSSYTNNWDWFQEIPIINFGGPNFIFLDHNRILITGRESDQVTLSLYDLMTLEYKKLITLESGGDCGYAGMVVKDGYLFLSYYSSHATPGGSSVYVAKMNINNLK
ncbi:hypothetical protein GJU43_05670 [Flavobacterium sp. LC2016-23]|uniref:hypothetical protein n=1 Tax=Flavobacterium sp. LC2016-23 TaxID=2666330 RepID=UPI0012B05097|nr:hypothetical protein [Flavobacterium sp. LC2016-23]MRX38753.1 hypothetical protein [Flavobacterium sp. LC2016-23]